MTLYANWTGKEYEITFVVGSYGQEDVEKVKVRYGESFELPVAESYSDTMAFGGWYTEANGEGFRITDYEGVSDGVWNYPRDYTVYAYWAEIFSFNQIQGGYSVSAGEGIDFVRIVNIPETYRGEPVTTVNDFSGCRSIEIINIPDTIQLISLGSEGTAFLNCSSLREVNIRTTGYATEPMYSSDEEGVLFTADGTELLYYPIGREGAYEIPYGTQIIADHVFMHARYLTEVVIPASVSEIGDEAFASDSSSAISGTLAGTLTKITFADATGAEGDAETVTIGSRAFANLKSLEEITLPANLAEYSADWFDKSWGAATSISSHYENLTYIGVAQGEGSYVSLNGVLCRVFGGHLLRDRALPDGGVGENGVYTIPDGVSSIGEEAFVNSMYLTKVVIPGYVSVIGESAFEGLETLQEVEFTGVANDTPLTIRTRAFYGCEGFISLTLPGNLLTLEAYAFGNTANLTSVRVESAGQPDETGVYTLDFANGAFSTTGSRTYVTSLTLGANVPVLSVSGVFGGTVVNIDVTGNPNYHTDEYGVLYNGNVTEILYYPNRIGAYVIPIRSRRSGRRCSATAISSRVSRSARTCPPSATMPSTTAPIWQASTLPWDAGKRADDRQLRLRPLRTADVHFAARRDDFAGRRGVLQLRAADDSHPVHRHLYGRKQRDGGRTNSTCSPHVPNSPRSKWRKTTPLMRISTAFCM